MKNTMEYRRNHRTIEENHRTIEENHRKIEENSIETIEKKNWNQSKNWWTVQMRDFSYKMQQMSDFSCKNQGREPGRQKKTNNKIKKSPKKCAPINKCPN